MKPICNNGASECIFPVWLNYYSHWAIFIGIWKIIICFRSIQLRNYLDYGRGISSNPAYFRHTLIVIRMNWNLSRSQRDIFRLDLPINSWNSEPGTSRKSYLSIIWSWIQNFLFFFISIAFFTDFSFESVQKMLKSYRLPRKFISTFSTSTNQITSIYLRTISWIFSLALACKTSMCSQRKIWIFISTFHALACFFEFVFVPGRHDASIFTYILVGKSSQRKQRISQQVFLFIFNFLCEKKR